MNFNYSRYSFINRSIFIIYKNIYFRFIKDIEKSQIQFFKYDIINLDCFI